MWNRGNRLRNVMWIVLAGVVLLLAALIVAIARGVEISAAASAGILVACGLISVTLIVSSSRMITDRGGTDRVQDFSGEGSAAGNVANWIVLADAHADRQEFEAAEKLYRRAAEAGHVGAMARLSEVLYELGRDEEAEYYRTQAREADS